MKHLAEYVLARGAAAGTRLLPGPGRRGIGRSLGSFVYALDSRHRAITLGNVETAFGREITAAERRSIAEGAFRHFGAMLFELLTLGRPSWEELSGRIDLEGAERFEEARARGKGVLLIAAHFGNWELHGIAHGYRFGKIHVVARELDNPYLNRWLARIREISGNEVIYKDRALGQMRKLLRAGETIAIVTDQNVHPQDAVFVDFFGRKAATTPVASWFALKTGAALVPAFCYPIEGGRYRAVYERAIDVDRYRDLDRDSAIRAVTQEIARLQESHIRRAPECWLWMHRRWRTRPPAEAGEKEISIRSSEGEAEDRMGEAALT
ncbi:MAG TPA: lysophospholipid acyltransferase family protein [Vicinamibacteria bacterium]|jgi:KDO2-lipid IV(A) lauroyltransferase